jgi:Phosphotransferase enzyme family
VSTDSGSDGSTTRRVLTIDYNDVGRQTGLPASVFSKSTPKFTSRAMTVPSAALTCEALFYDRIRPSLDIEAPRGYYMAVDNRSGRSMFLMENVASTKDATFGDPTKHYIDRTRADAIITTLATVHGTLWESPRFAGDLRIVKNAHRWQIDVNGTIDFPRRALIGFDRAASVFPTGFRRRRAEVFPALMGSLAMHTSAPNTLLHSDVHSRNWYLTPDGGMGLYDWQVITRGIWALDVSADQQIPKMVCQPVDAQRSSHDTAGDNRPQLRSATAHPGRRSAHRSPVLDGVRVRRAISARAQHPGQSSGASAISSPPVCRNRGAHSRGRRSGSVAFATSHQ